ncbi:helix-turn-helix domain-containing protein [Shewanella xiamenensis]|uniref:helix-turn-helix domain-containing protein n=1 Tax=Shewanella xiamenensis TaxID=332186 RepID=UPI0004D94416|nr:hypothetical protein SXM_3355 [Shewanella xiamenensis]
MARVRSHELKSLFSSRLQKIRSELGMTQLELSEILEVDSSYLSLMERSKKPIPISDFFIVCSLLPRERAIKLIIEVMDEVNKNENTNCKE